VFTRRYIDKCSVNRKVFYVARSCQYFCVVYTVKVTPKITAAKGCYEPAGIK